MHPVRLFCWHFMAYPYLPADFDARYDTGWVTVPNELWDRDRAGRRLSGIYRPARLCRRAGFRRHGAERASSEHLRPDAVAQHHRGRAHAAHQARQDRRARQSPAAASQPAARGGRIRDDRQHERRPVDRRACDRRRTGGVQLQCAAAAGPRPVLGRGRSDQARVDGARPVRARRQVLSAALRQFVAAADASGRIRRSGSRARSASKPWRRPPSADTTISSRRAPTVLRPSGRPSVSARSSSAMAALFILSAWAC